MASGIRDFDSNIRLNGYLDLNDEILYVGLSQVAKIESDTLNSLLKITNGNGISLIGTVLITDTVYSAGAKYAADYSANFTSLSLVTKGWVENAISSITGTNDWNLITTGDLQLYPAVTGSVIPFNNDANDLGSLTERWKDLYLGSKIDFATSLLFSYNNTSDVITLSTDLLTLHDITSINSDVTAAEIYLNDGWDGSGFGADGATWNTSWLYMLPSYSTLYGSTNIKNHIELSATDIDATNTGRIILYTSKGAGDLWYAKDYINLESRESISIVKYDWTLDTIQGGLIYSAGGGTGSGWEIFTTETYQKGLNIVNDMAYYIDGGTIANINAAADKVLVTKEWVNSLVGSINTNNDWNLLTSGDLQLYPAITGSVIPFNNDANDLGSLSNRWKDLYLGSKIDYSSDLDFYYNNTTLIASLKSTGELCLGASLPSGQLIYAQRDQDSFTNGYITNVNPTANATASWVAASDTVITFLSSLSSAHTILPSTGAVGTYSSNFAIVSGQVGSADTIFYTSGIGSSFERMRILGTGDISISPAGSTVATWSSTGLILNDNTVISSTLGTSSLSLSYTGIGNLISLGVDGYNNLTIYKDVLPSGSYTMLIGETDLFLETAYNKIILKSVTTFTSIGTGVDGDIIVGDGTSFSSHSSHPRSPVIISSRNASIPTGVINTVVAGGDGIIVNASDTLYAANLELQGNVLGKYTVQPDTQAGWDDLSIPTKKYVDDVVTGSKKTWEWNAGSNNINVNNSFLSKADGTSSNLSPYVAWFACKLVAISLSSGAASTWTAQVYKNGILLASLSSGGLQYNYVSGLTDAIAAGDRISFRVSGTGVNRPSINALFQEN